MHALATHELERKSQKKSEKIRTNQNKSGKIRIK